MVLDIEEIAKCMAMYEVDPQEQINKTKFRSMFVEKWGVSCGASILEVGCGQGETTAVLAEAVGVNGYVIATDPASYTYGSPITVGESAKFLSKSRLGNRISFHFNSKISDDELPFINKEFDYVVLAHCSYYFDSQKDLLNTFISAKKWAKTLCFSEWDTLVRSINQVSHLLTIFVHGQVEAFKATSTANIRSPFSRQEVERLLGSAGWLIAHSFTVNALQSQEDVLWEVDVCLERIITEMESLKLPEKLYNLIMWQLDALEMYRKTYPVEPLPSYCLIAKSE